MGGLELSLVALLLLVGAMVGVSFWRSWNSSEALPLRGLGLPRGSVRSLLAFTIVGAFIIFIFFGKEALGSTSLYETVLASMLTLVGSVTGFYFGARTGQSPEDLTTPPSRDKPRSSDQPNGGVASRSDASGSGQPEEGNPT